MYIRFVLLPVVFFLFVPFLAAQKDLERQLQRKIEITERYFEDGDYKKAAEEAEKLYKKYDKKAGYLGTHIQNYLVKYYEATGEVLKFKDASENLLKKRKVKGDNSLGYGLALLKAAHYYAEYSFTNQAQIYLDEAKKVLGERPKTSYAQEEMLTTEALIALRQGRFKDYLSKQADELIKVRKQLIGKETSYYSDLSHQTEVRNLSDREQARRKVAYAQALTTKADASRLAGNYKDAQKYIDQADNWIKDELSTRSLAYVRNQKARAELMIDNGDEREKIRQLIEKTIYRAEKVVSTVHKDYLELHQLLIDYYLNSGFVSNEVKEEGFSMIPGFFQNAKYNNRSIRQRWELERNAAKYYGTDRLPYSIALQADAMWHYENQRYQQSLGLLKGLHKNTNIIPQNHQRRLDVLKDAYLVRLAADDYQKAGELLEEWIDAHERIHGNNTLGFHLAKIKLAQYYLNYTEKFEAAGKLYQTHTKALEEFVNTNSLIYIGVLNEWLEFYIINEDFEEANKISNQLLSLVKKRYGDEHVRYAAQLEMAAQLNMIQSDYKKVDAQVSQMLSIYEKQYNPSLAFEHSKALETAAHYYMIMGLYEKAEELLSQAEKKFSRSSQSIANSSSAEELAYLYIETSDFRAAEAILRTAIAQKEKRYGKESRFLINTYNQMARLEFADGQYIEAEEYANRSLDIARKVFGDKSLRTVESLGILADYYLAIGDYEKALEVSSKSLDIKTEVLGKDHLDRANTLIQLARINYYEGAEWDKVVALLDDAENVLINNLGKTTPVYAGFLKTSAELYISHKDLAQAERKLADALIILKKIPSASLVSLAEINVSLGNLEVEQGNPEGARSFYEDARKSYLRLFSKSHPKYVELLGRIARMYYVDNDFKRSEKYISEVIEKHKEYIQTTFSALSEREKAKNWEQIRPDFEFFTQLVVKLQPKKNKLLEELYDNTLLTKGILLGQSQKLRNSILSRSPEDTVRKNFMAWQEKQKILQSALALNSEQLKEEEIDVRSLQKEIDDLSKILSKQSNSFAAASSEEQVSWKDIQQKLGNKDYAIEIIRFREFDKNFTDKINYLALILPSSGKVKYALIEEGNDMEDDKLQFYKNTMEFGVEDLESYQTYWKPIAEQISNDANRIYLSSDGVYNQINVETLRIDENDFVIDRFFVVQVTNTKEVLDEAKNSFPENFVLFGDPDFYQTQQGIESYLPLPGARREVESISSQLKGLNKNVDVFIDAAAKESIIKAIESNKNPVLHFATHGLFKADISQLERERAAALGTYNNPLMRSGLLFTGGGDLVQNSNVHEYNRAEGVLTASEVINLNIPSPLVLLSACETGRGDTKVGEGVYGLQRSFLVAGADALLMSLFKVDDEATRELMRIFYKNWHSSKDKRAALRDAKRELRQNEDFADPIFWGAFVMVGK